MKVQGIDVEGAIKTAREHLETDHDISNGLRSTIELLLVLISVLVNTINLKSKNSSKPPSSDPNRKKNKQKGKSGRKPGGQKGHIGSTFETVDEPDEIVVLQVDTDILPKDRKFH